MGKVVKKGSLVLKLQILMRNEDTKQGTFSSFFFSRKYIFTTTDYVCNKNFQEAILFKHLGYYIKRLIFILFFKLSFEVCILVQLKE